MLFNTDLERELERYDKKQISIATAYDENLTQPFIIDIGNTGYFYAKEFERDSDYTTLKVKGFKNESDN
jgi:hypothetical protein